jgi:Xaa-Pro aminopeptidase
VSVDEQSAGLLEAQAKAYELFAAIDDKALIRAGVGERQLSDEIRDLAADLLGVTRHWHKRIIRSGPNTLLPYRANPPDRVLGEDDILFADFGPIFEAWEADFGRTYVLGNDPHKIRLRDTLPQVFTAGREHFMEQPDITGAELWDFMLEQAAEHDYEWGGRVAGHILGEFPHFDDPDHADLYDIVPANNQPLRRHDGDGRALHWILEVHLVDRKRVIGGFYEELLDL